MRKLFERQLEKARTPEGEVDLAVLEQLVTAAYLEAEQDRARTDRSIELMVGELGAFQAGLEAEIDTRTSQLRRSQEQLRKQNGLFAAALENMSQGIAMFDRNRRLLVCNRQFLEMYDVPQKFGRRGTTLAAILKARIASQSAPEEAASYLKERLEAAESGQAASVTHQLQNGRVFLVSHRPMPDGGWVTTHRDITDLHAMEAELTHQAFHDSLTELPNRHMILQRIRSAFDSHGQGFSVLCLDLDGFKSVNDTMGHSAGDKLLRQLAARLRDALGENGMVGRMGGDEFAVILTGGGADAAMALAGRLREVVERPFQIDEKAVTIATSIGVATAPADGSTPDQLLRAADLALYAAKRNGRGSIRRFEPELAQAEVDRHELERDLHRALENGEFELEYQPIVDLRTQRCSGFEALLRWHHPARGSVPPAEFVPLAEELGLIVPIGEWVLREALAEAASWAEPLRIAVNVSSAQFRHGNLVTTIIHALAASGIAHERVEVEITESVFLQNSEANLEALRQLHAIGIRIALDDFGTGYSALSYLLSFPFDKIKIDGTFVRALSHAGVAHTIVRSVAEIGHHMGLTTTAEGVETAEQLRNVHALGYTEAQGFVIARPMSARAVRRMLGDVEERRHRGLVRAVG